MEHLPSVMRAAQRIIDDLDGGRSGSVIDEIEKDSVASIIEQETGLTELLAAAEEAGDLMDHAANGVDEFGGDSRISVDPVRKRLEAAIAKARKEQP